MFFAFEGEPILDASFFPGGMPVTRLDDYQKLFKEVSNQKAIGEASTIYLYAAKAAERIYRYLPATKLIAILRDPAERAFSHYFFNRQLGRENQPDFNTAIKAEPERMHRNMNSRWFYRDRGYYYAQLKRYFDLFPRGQLQIHLYEDFCSERLGVVRSVLSFLELDEDMMPDISMEHNVTAIPRNRAIDHLLNRPTFVRPLVRSYLPAKGRRRLLKWLNRVNSTRPQLPPEIRAELIAGYREDILKLQDILGRDLSAWLRTDGARPVVAPNRTRIVSR